MLTLTHLPGRPRPFRPALHRYCRRLTGSVWDAEDLVQDALLRVFGQIGKRNASIGNLQSYLIRTATHLWIDGLRRAEVQRTALERAADPIDTSWSRTSGDGERARAVREAANTLLVELPPRERAALLLKDVFDLSLEETALTLRTTVGAVKSALHRGRDRLKDLDAESSRSAPRASDALIDQFVRAMNHRDIEGVYALLHESATAELVGGNVMEGLDQYKSYFAHAQMPSPLFEPEPYPRYALAHYAAEPIVVTSRRWKDQSHISSIERFEETAGKISLIRGYCFCPDTMRFIGQALGLPALTDAEGLAEAIQRLTRAQQPSRTGGYRSP